MKKTALIFMFIMIGALAAGAAPAMAIAPPDGTEPDCGPKLATASAVAYWRSYGDYHERVLTVDEKIQSVGGCVPCAIRIDEIAADNGVTVESSLPVDLGEIPSGASLQVRYRVPAGVAKFKRHLRPVCAPRPPEPPVSQSRLTIDPPVAYANDGCPLPPTDAAITASLPEDRHYGPRRFTVRLVDEDGSPAVGKQIKWSLSNNMMFRILESTAVTDENGEAYAVVEPPMYFICIAPYFDRSSTVVGAISEDGQAAEALFFYTRCAPFGAEPPWSGE